MAKLPTPRPVTFRQLYVIAKSVFEADLTIDNLEWCERIKDTLVKSNLGYPERPEAIHNAMRAVEHMVARPDPPPLRKWVPPPEPPPHPDATPEGLRRRDAIRAKLEAIAAGKAMPVLHGETHTIEQINAERRAQQAKSKPTHRLTPKGWVPL